jgi:choice-of-anchor C domain-containing protein
MARIGIGLALCLLSGAAWCAPFQDGSFEDTADNCNQYNVSGNAIPGWTIYAGNVDWEAGCDGWAASDGTHSLDLVGDGAGGIGGIEQTFDTTPGAVYEVRFDLAGNPGNVPVVKPLAVTVAGVEHDFTFDTTGRTATDMGWTRETFTFVATSASTTISFYSDVSASGGINAGPALDNVRIFPLASFVTEDVPLDWVNWAAALVLGCAGLLALARRRVPRT